MSFHLSAFSLQHSWSIVLCAFALDLILGDPRWFPHPVVLMGYLISSLEDIFRRFTRGKKAELAAGGVMAFTVPVAAYGVTYQVMHVAAYGVTYQVMHVAASVNIWVGWITAIFLGYTTIAASSLYTESRKVAVLLSNGDIQGARKGLSYLVGRDTHNLDERGVVRALVETVAENASDGVIAPLFYLAIGGPPLAMAYKAVNTLDSMVGYKNDRYLYFGRASARLDDLVNFIPARLSALFLIMSAFLLGKDWEGACKMVLRDGRNHHSPNSGYPEAAVAGAIGRRLGGLSYYGGVPGNKPFIGDERGEFQFRDVGEAGILMLTASVLMVLISASIIAGIEQ